MFQQIMSDRNPVVVPNCKKAIVESPVEVFGQDKAISWIVGASNFDRYYVGRIEIPAVIVGVDDLR